MFDGHSFGDKRVATVDGRNYPSGLMEHCSQETHRPRVKATALSHGMPLLACLTALIACSRDPSPAQIVYEHSAIEVEGRGQIDLPLDVPVDSHVRITVSSQSVDVRVAVMSSSNPLIVYADAPGRRLGVETLLLAPPHDEQVTVRIAGHDNRRARGQIHVKADILPTATVADRRRLEAAALESKANIAFNDLTRGRAAAALFDTAATLHQQNGDSLGAGIALLQAAGARYARLADWQGAATLAARASDHLDRAKAQVQAASALRLEGAALAAVAGVMDARPAARARVRARARRCLTEAADRFESLGLAYEAGYAINYRGVSFQEGGEPERARADFLHALSLFKATGDEPAQALSLQSLAVLSLEDGRLADALSAFDKALSLIPPEEEPENYAHTLHNSAVSLQVLGRFDEAIARFYEAGQLLRRSGDRDGEARALHGIATTLRHAGEPGRARDLLHAAIELRRDTGARREQAVSLIVLGAIERDAGNLDEAIELHREAAQLVNAPNDRARVLLALAQDYLAAGRGIEAREQLQELLKLELPATHRHVGAGLTELGALEASEGHVRAAQTAFARAIAVNGASGSLIEQARAYHRRAEASMQVGDTRAVLDDTAAALRLFDSVGLRGTHAETRAVFRASYRSVLELRISALLTEAQEFRQQGHPILAQERMRAAFLASDGSRAERLGELAPGTDRTDATSVARLAKRREVYELLAGKRQRLDRLLEETTPDTRQVEKLIRDLETLRAEAALINARLDRNNSSSRDGPCEAGDRWLARVPHGTLVVEYFLGTKNGWLFQVDDSGVTVHTLPEPGQVDALARALYEAWRDPLNPPAAGTEKAEQLVSAALRPVTASRDARRLFLVPDGALHLVPMAVLARWAWPDLRPGAAVVVPSLCSILSTPQRHAAEPDRLLAVIADPVFATDDPRLPARALGPASRNPVRLAAGGLATEPPLTRAARDLAALRRLPSTAIEAREIAALAGNPAATLMLVGFDAARSRVTSADLQRYRIVHFATHAWSDSQDPALASLALSRFDRTGVPLDAALRGYEIARMRLNADLVALSGCDTAVGREISGEAPVGLTQAFLDAGARSVLSTLWQVPDTSTAVLMREFYRALLKERLSAPEALAFAQDQVRGRPRWARPYYWAGFQLVSLAPTTVISNRVE